jgi:hypothetical protein
MIQMGVHKTEHPSTMICNVWILTDRANSTWVKAYSIPTSWGHKMDAFMPLRMMMRDGGKLLFYYLAPYLAEPRVLRAYDSRDGTCTTVMTMPKHTYERIGLCSLSVLWSRQNLMAHDAKSTIIEP